MELKVLLVSITCLSIFSVVSVHSAEGEETSMETSSVSECLCRLPQQALYSRLEEVYEGYNISINCLEFGREAYLERAIVSVFSETEQRRDVIECRLEGDVALVTPSVEAPDRFDIRDMSYTGCVRCMDSNATGADICYEPCDSTCERCYGDLNTCTRCTACQQPSSEMCKSTKNSSGLMCFEECQPNQEPNTDLYNTCECQEGYYMLYDTYKPFGPGPNPSLEDQEEARLNHCPEDIKEMVRTFTCTKDCTRRGALVNFSVNEESHICFACGLEDCVNCENPDDHPECTRCIKERVLFEGECFSCPRREIAFEALDQEHEIEEEEQKKRKTSIQLAVALPIVCVAVMLFFVLMSVFAHYRYPHISHRGHKRHRKPNDPQLPQDGVTTSDDESRQLESSQVWRARPTIRLR